MLCCPRRKITYFACASGSEQAVRLSMARTMPPVQPQLLVKQSLQSRAMQKLGCSSKYCSMCCAPVYSVHAAAATHTWNRTMTGRGLTR